MMHLGIFLKPRAIFEGGAEHIKTGSSRVVIQFREAEEGENGGTRFQKHDVVFSLYIRAVFLNLGNLNIGWLQVPELKSIHLQVPKVETHCIRILMLILLTLNKNFKNFCPRMLRSMAWLLTVETGYPYPSSCSSPLIYRRFFKKDKDTKAWECRIFTYPVTVSINPMKSSSSEAILSVGGEKNQEGRDDKISIVSRFFFAHN